MLFKHYGKHLRKSHLKVSRSVDIFEGLGDFDKNVVDGLVDEKC
jgi:hypothetical protein